MTPLVQTHYDDISWRMLLDGGIAARIADTSLRLAQLSYKAVVSKREPLELPLEEVPQLTCCAGLLTSHVRHYTKVCRYETGT